MGLGEGGEQSLNAEDRLRLEQYVAAQVAHVGGDVVDDDDVPAVANGMVNQPLLVGPRASRNGAFHGRLLRSVGVTHLGAFG